MRGAGDGCRVRIEGTAAQVAAAKLVQEACEAESESESNRSPKRSQSQSRRSGPQPSFEA